MEKLLEVTVKKQMQETASDPLQTVRNKQKEMLLVPLDVDGDYGDEEFRRFHLNLEID